MQRIITPMWEMTTIDADTMAEDDIIEIVLNKMNEKKEALEKAEISRKELASSYLQHYVSDAFRKTFKTLNLFNDAKSETRLSGVQHQISNKASVFITSRFK